MSRARHARLWIVLFIALCADSARAQPWAGPAGLGVEVKDRGGRPVGGASVVLAYLGTAGNGPRLETDAAGGAEVAGLAEGLWVVSVRHPQFLGYDAQVRLEAGRKPVEEKTFQVKFGDSTERLRIRIYSVAGPPRGATGAPRAPERERPAGRSEAAGEARSTQREAARAARDQARTEEQEARRREREERERRRTAGAARPQPLPAPASARDAASPSPSAPERPAPPAEATPNPRDRPQQAAAPSPVPAAPAPIETAAPTPPREDPPPIAEPRTAAPPAPAPAPVPPPPRSGSLRASRDGSCIECRPNEWAATAGGESRSAGPPPCPDTLRPLVTALAQRVAAEPQPGDEAGFAGPLLAASLTVPAEIAAVARDFATGGCQVLAVKLPRGAGFQGFQLEVEGPVGVLPCIPDQDCPGGAGRWSALPVVEDTPSGKVIGAAFLHAGATSAWRPRLTIYFLPPPGWNP